MIKPMTVGEDDAFALLLSVAQEDGDLERQLTAILSLPTFHRVSLLNTLIRELRMKDASEDAVRSVAYLLDDDVAARALAILKGNADS